MRSSIIASIIALAATQAAAQYTNQSAPFELILLSSNATINGSALEACHEGAGIEGLCVATQFPTPVNSNYTFNTSTNTGTVYNASLGEPGVLVYSLVGGNFVESEALVFDYNPTSNVQLPLFEGTEEELLVAFDECGLLNIQGYTDDTVYPPILGTQAYYRWYVCIITGAYSYQTLAWVTGDAPPENPTCQPVNVTRQFI